MTEAVFQPKLLVGADIRANATHNIFGDFGHANLLALGLPPLPQFIGGVFFCRSNKHMIWVDARTDVATVA